MSTAFVMNNGDSGVSGRVFRVVAAVDRLVTQVGATGTHQLIGTNGIGAPMHHVTGPTTPMGGGGGGGGAPTQLLLPASHT